MFIYIDRKSVCHPKIYQTISFWISYVKLKTLKYYINSQNSAYILTVKSVSHLLIYQTDFILYKFCKIKKLIFLGGSNPYTGREVKAY